MRLLLIDNYDSFTFNLYQQFLVEGKEFDCSINVFRNDEVSFGFIKEHLWDGLIISPGPGGPEDTGICDLLIDFYKGKIPILGVCLGHQLIANKYGAKIERADHALHGKTSKIFHNDSALFKNLPSPFLAARYHSLIAKENSIAAPLRVDARTEAGEVMGVSIETELIFSVQFHPESFLTEGGNIIAKNFLKIISESK
jgi:anthranilate synthase/aminodeoxychorismate synthase-like glutamine amidotransferase